MRVMVISCPRFCVIRCASTFRIMSLAVNSAADDSGVPLKADAQRMENKTINCLNRCAIPADPHLKYQLKNDRHPTRWFSPDRVLKCLLESTLLFNLCYQLQIMELVHGDKSAYYSAQYHVASIAARSVANIRDSGGVSGQVIFRCHAPDKKRIKPGGRIFFSISCSRS